MLVQARSTTARGRATRSVSAFKIALIIIVDSTSLIHAWALKCRKRKESSSGARKQERENDGLCYFVEIPRSDTNEGGAISIEVIVTSEL